MKQLKFYCNFLNDKVNTSHLQYFLDLVLEKDVKAQSSIWIFEYWDKIGYQKVFHHQKERMPFVL